MKSFSFSRIDAGLVFKVTINDLITYGSCFASIGSKLIELIYETLQEYPKLELMVEMIIESMVELKDKTMIEMMVVMTKTTFLALYINVLCLSFQFIQS